MARGQHLLQLLPEVVNDEPEHELLEVLVARGKSEDLRSQRVVD